MTAPAETLPAGCTHCWHTPSSSLTLASNPPQDQFVCCHCGANEWRSRPIPTAAPAPREDRELAMLVARIAHALEVQPDDDTPDHRDAVVALAALRERAETAERDRDEARATLTEEVRTLREAVDYVAQHGHTLMSLMHALANCTEERLVDLLYSRMEIPTLAECAEQRDAFRAAGIALSPRNPALHPTPETQEPTA